MAMTQRVGLMNSYLVLSTKANLTIHIWINKYDAVIDMCNPIGVLIYLKSNLLYFA